MNENATIQVNLNYQMKEADTREYILHDAIYMKFKDRQNSSMEKKKIRTMIAYRGRRFAGTEVLKLSVLIKIFFVLVGTVLTRIYVYTPNSLIYMDLYISFCVNLFN